MLVGRARAAAGAAGAQARAVCRKFAEPEDSRGEPAQGARRGRGQTRADSTERGGQGEKCCRRTAGPANKKDVLLCWCPCPDANKAQATIPSCHPPCHVARAPAYPIVPSPAPCRMQRGRGGRIVADAPQHIVTEATEPVCWQHTDVAGPVPHVSSSRRAIPAAARQHSYVYL